VALTTTSLALGPVLLPVATALGYLLLGWRPATAWFGCAGAAGLLGAAVALAVGVTRSGPYQALGAAVYVDAVTGFMLIVIGAVGLLATAATPAFFRAELEAGRSTPRTAARHSVLVQLFLAAMAAAVLAGNLGLLWIAVEATTIVTAFLVGQRHTRTAVEAAWKYVVICSTGIALALLGVVLVNYAAAHGSGGPAGLDLVALRAAAPGLDPGVTKFAVALLLLGFGAKAGLAPLHAWLPDAHSQAPAPVSALMSGVLLSVALYAIMRVKVIADLAVGVGFTRSLLVAMALTSLVLAASLLIGQRDYKRMLAYSSIEHMALACFGVAIGGRPALAAVLLHILGHGITKATLFIGAGRMVQVTGSSRIAEVRGLAAGQPALAGVVGIGVLALLGFPPFSVFASELGIARAGLGSELAWPTAVALLLVLVIAGALVMHTGRMLLGAPPDGPGAATGVAVRQALPRSTATVLVGGLVVCAGLGVLAEPVAPLLQAAATVLGGVR
jgi:hydrogenase-4 component F